MLGAVLEKEGAQSDQDDEPVQIVFTVQFSCTECGGPCQKDYDLPGYYHCERCDRTSKHVLIG